MEILPGTVRHDLAERNGMARTFATKSDQPPGSGYENTENYFHIMESL